ncbi:MAG: SRPBCC family protein [Bacteroidia bacterium]|nr:SRPBCC family protein [Bacteroidia bacterium]HQV01200.1 SRPBCC family protein [Bacteroidia bacterium]
MKILKKILFIISALIGLILLSGLFIPNEYTVSNSLNIRKPQTEVIDFVKLLDNQKHYSVWVMADKELNPTITGTDGTVGATQSWNSKMDEVGQGSQTITYMDDKCIKIDLDFKRPFESKAKAEMLFEKISDNETTLTMKFYGVSPFPFNIMSFYMGRFFISNAQNDNLANLKKILESK